MTPTIIETLGVKSYHKGLQNCLMLVQRGMDKGLSLQDSYDSAKKVIGKTVEEPEPPVGNGAEPIRNLPEDDGREDR